MAGLSVVLPHHQLRLQRVTVTFNDSSENTLPFLLFCKPLASKRPFKPVNHTAYVTCLPPSRTVARSPFSFCGRVGLAFFRFVPHSAPVQACVLLVPFPRKLFSPACPGLHLTSQAPAQRGAPAHPNSRLSHSSPLSHSLSRVYYFHGAHPHLKLPFLFTEAFVSFIYSFTVGLSLLQCNSRGAGP